MNREQRIEMLTSNLAACARSRLRGLLRERALLATDLADLLDMSDGRVSTVLASDNMQLRTLVKMFDAVDMDVRLVFEKR